MIATIIDAAIIVILIFFTFQGGRKGLILTLFSLLAVFVAWFGAKAITNSFTEPVANILRPSIRLTISDLLRGEAPLVQPDPDGETTPAPSRPAISLPGQSVDANAEEDREAAFGLEQILDVLGESGLFTGLQGFLEGAASEGMLTVTTTAAQAVSDYLARLIASSLLFGLSFLLILLVWFLVSRAMDLAFDLPILSVVNWIGGGLIGLAKGLILVLVLVWLGRLTGFLTDANAGPVAALMDVEKLSETLDSLILNAALR